MQTIIFGLEMINRCSRVIINYAHGRRTSHFVSPIVPSETEWALRTKILSRLVHKRTILPGISNEGRDVILSQHSQDPVPVKCIAKATPQAILKEG
jgi:hypothetical protein